MQLEVDRTREAVRAMICKEGVSQTVEYLQGGKMDQSFRSDLRKAGIITSTGIDLSELPVRKSDLFTAATISETQSIVRGLIKQIGIDEVINDFSKEQNQLIKRELIEARLMSEDGYVILSSFYDLANLTEKSSMTGSIQPVTSQASLQ